jgi:hypothetical protein
MIHSQGLKHPVQKPQIPVGSEKYGQQKKQGYVFLFLSREIKVSLQRFDTLQRFESRTSPFQ